MGGKSDNTKFAAEIPLLLALVNEASSLPNEINEHTIIDSLDLSRIYDSVKVLESLRYALPIALLSKTDFVRNYRIAVNFVNHLNKYFSANAISKPDKFYWQATEAGKKDPTKPSDILFVGHDIEGVSVKAGAPNQFNLGAKDFNFGHLRGDELIGIIAPNEFYPLLRLVKELTLNIPIGSSWSKDNRGKYCITRLTEDTYSIKTDDIINSYTKTQLLNNEEPKYVRRVFGDKYQTIKKHPDILNLRIRLTTKLSEIIPEVYSAELKTNPVLSMILGGFTAKEYFYADFGNNELFCVPSKNSLPSSFRIENIPSSSIFGSGYKMKCKIILSESRFATVESWFRYHTGTFAGPPQNMIQNLKGKENIWQRIA